MKHNIVVVTNRKICVKAHPEYCSMDVCKMYADKIASDTAQKNASCDEEAINECASLLVQLEKIVKRDDIAFVILREKDLQKDVYMSLYSLAYNICKDAGVRLNAHSFIGAVKLRQGIHLSMPALREYDNALNGIEYGASIHSVEEAVEAQRLGARYIIAGNIYETECKAGLPGRGLEFLSKVCGSVNIPVYAIGGINMARIDEIEDAGAAGGCMMSGMMRL